MVVDAHVHLVDFNLGYINKLSGKFKFIFAVSEDFDESIKAIEISERFDFIYPGIGLHPWVIERNKVDEIIELRKDIKKKFFFGEIGLDKKFHPETFEKQREIFERFLEIAFEEKIPINVHSAGAWRETLDFIKRYEVGRVIFHWYTGPEDVLKEIIDFGYFVTFNPAISVQKRQRKILEKTPIENILTESDGPYNYKGIFMEPLRIEDVIREIARIKEIDEKEVERIIVKNAKKFLGL